MRVCLRAVMSRSLFPDKKVNSMANPVSVPINALRSAKGVDTEDVEMQRMQMQMQMQQTRGQTEAPKVDQRDDDDAAIKEVLAEMNAETERVTRDISSVADEKYREMNMPVMHPSAYQHNNQYHTGGNVGDEYMRSPYNSYALRSAAVGEGIQNNVPEGGSSMFNNAINNLTRDMKLFIIVAAIVLLLESSMLDGLIFSRVASRVSIPYIGVISKIVFAVIVFAIMRSLLI